MQNINQQIDTFVEEFNHSVYHPILNREVGLPTLSKQFLSFLLLPKLNGETWSEEIQQAAIAVCAVQAAFKAHDDVGLQDVTSDEEQLRVLAGDYLSGIYYSILASVPDFQFIYQLSKAIGHINELKVERYTDLARKSSADTDFEAIQEIQSACVVQFLNTYGFERYVPLAQKGLSLLAFHNDEKHSTESTTTYWYYEEDQEEKKRKKLRLEMERLLQESTFLTPHISQLVQEITLPLLGKTI